MLYNIDRNLEKYKVQLWGYPKEVGSQEVAESRSYEERMWGKGTGEEAACT